MRAFGHIESTFWRNPKVRRLSPDAERMLLYLFSCPHGNSVGTFVLSLSYAASDLRWEVGRTDRTLSELLLERFIDYDNRFETVSVLGWWGHNSIQNANVAKRCIADIDVLPNSPIKQQAIETLLANTEFHPTVQKQLKEGLTQQLRKLSQERSRKGLPEQSRNPNLSYPIQNQPEPRLARETEQPSLIDTPAGGGGWQDGKQERTSIGEPERVTAHAVDPAADLEALEVDDGDQAEGMGEADTLDGDTAVATGDPWVDAHIPIRATEGEPTTTAADIPQPRQDPPSAPKQDSATDRTGGSAGPPDQPPIEPSEAEVRATVEGFFALRDRYWPNESRLPAPTMTIASQVRDMLKHGGNRAIILELTERGMRVQAQRGDSPPASFGAYKHSLADGIRAMKAAGQGFLNGAGAKNGNGHHPPGLKRISPAKMTKMLEEEAKRRKVLELSPRAAKEYLFSQGIDASDFY